MKRALWMLLVALLAVRLVTAQTKYEIDVTHSNVMFTVTHLVVSEVTGHFKDFSATLTINNPDFSDATVEMNIKVASITTDNERRDNHLRSEDFFWVEKYPEITFKSKSFKKIGENQYKVSGDFTMRGVTKAIELDAAYRGEVKDGYGNVKAGWKVTAVVNRFDHGLKWNALVEGGGAVVGQDVTMTVNAQFLKK